LSNATADCHWRLCGFGIERRGRNGLYYYYYYEPRRLQHRINAIDTERKLHTICVSLNLNPDSYYEISLITFTCRLSSPHTPYPALRYPLYSQDVQPSIITHNSITLPSDISLSIPHCSEQVSLRGHAGRVVFHCINGLRKTQSIHNINNNM